MKILVGAETFGYGPITTGLMVASELKNKGFNFDFIGSGIALEQAKMSNLFNNYYECDTFDFISLEQNLNIFKNYDIYLSAENVNGALFAMKNNMKKVYYIDNLMWMWDKIPDGLENVDKYFISDIIPSKENFNRIGRNIKNPIFLGPIRDIQKQKEIEKKNKLLINIGGASSFLLNKDEIISFYKKIIKIILSSKLINKFKEILICGGSDVIENLLDFENESIRVRTLPNDLYLKEMSESSYCILAPGLGNFIETIGQDKNIMFLPPINYSQFLQIEYYRKLDLGLKSINWNDFSFYEEIPLYLPEEDGVEKVLNNVSSFMKSNSDNKILDKINLFISDNQSKTFTRRSKYINAMEKNSISKITKEIINDINNE